MNSNNDFVIVINIRCEFETFKDLLRQANIEWISIKEDKLKFYYDELTICILDTNLNRQEFFDKINSYPKINREINEIQFCKKEEEN